MNISVQHKILSLKRKEDIENLLAIGLKKHTKYGVFFFGIEQKSNDESIKFAVLIKKNVGKAIWRNYCKRIVREYVKNHIELFRNFKETIFIYNYVGQINYDLLEKELNKQLKNK